MGKPMSKVCDVRVPGPLAPFAAGFHPVTSGGTPPADRSDRAASPPSLAVTGWDADFRRIEPQALILFAVIVKRAYLVAGRWSARAAGSQTEVGW
jgi:hypothetical protein